MAGLDDHGQTSSALGNKPSQRCQGAFIYYDFKELEVTYRDRPDSITTPASTKKVCSFREDFKGLGQCCKGLCIKESDSPVMKLYQLLTTPVLTSLMCHVNR